MVTLATALYTAVGGIRAVIWTDVLQIVVLFAALGFSLFYLLGHIPGGWAGRMRHCSGPDDWRDVRLRDRVLRRDFGEM